MQTATSVAEVVGSGLCIGCGLCEAVSERRVTMQMNKAGALRPMPADGFTVAEEKLILSACPGVSVMPRTDAAVANEDLVWGQYLYMCVAFAADADIRFRASTGGVLTALAVHLLRTQKIKFVLQTCADPDNPAHSRWVCASTVQEVVAAAGSRYQPVAPLAGLYAALQCNESFAIVAKPCDLSALHLLSQQDARVNRLCVSRLAMVCGGQSRFGKTVDFLAAAEIPEDSVSIMRYRGYGNPGRTRAESRDGIAYEKSYVEMWADEAGWQIDTRCNFCADALGECADVAAADIWPGGTPTGEDAGFNGIVVRTQAGKQLVEAAVAAGDLIVGDSMCAAQLDDCQPHQVNKKIRLAARLQGRDEAGLPTLSAEGLRLTELAKRLSTEEYEREKQATIDRAKRGRFSS